MWCRLQNLCLLELGSLLFLSVWNFWCFKVTCCSLARICSYQCDIYLTCGHFGLKWHPPRNFAHPPKNCRPIQVFFPTLGKGCLTLPLLQRISKQRSPQMKKGVAFDSLVRRHSFCFPCFARVCMLYLIYKYGISYVHFSVRFVWLFNLVVLQ